MLTASAVHTSAQNTQASQVAEPQPTPILPKFDPGISSAAIPWENIMEKDILWKKRVWRSIDASYGENSGSFGYRNGSPNSNSFVSVLINGVMSDKIKAYADERFTTVLTKDLFIELLKGIGPGGNISHYSLKEDWLFTNTTPQGRMEVRIVGIAPEIEATDSAGKIITQPLFWIYYPDCRDFLAQFKSGYKDEHAVPYNWNEYFESRQFKSKIVRVENRVDRTDNQSSK